MSSMTNKDFDNQTTRNNPDSSEQGEALETICANCGVKLYQTTDPNNIHWYHAGTGDVRCPTRFAKPRRASVAAVAGDPLKKLSSRIGDVINESLRSYRCQHTKELPDLENGLSLVDLLTPEPDKDVTRGVEECDLLADYIWSDVDDAIKEYAAVSSSLPAEPPPNDALIQLLNAALLHPESAEGNIRQVVEILSATADENKRLRDHIADLDHDLEATIKEQDAFYRRMMHDNA